MSIKQIFKNFGMLFRKNTIFFIGQFVLTSLFLFGSILAAVPFDGQIVNEVTNSITESAKKSKIGLSLSSLQIKPRGNSDYWMYSSNTLQDFQMRNQTNDGYKSYVFAAYEPYESYSPFDFNNESSSVLLFESKFRNDNFYFDLPLLAGHLPRNVPKTTIFLIDLFADKLIGSDGSYENLIGETIVTSSKTFDSVEKSSYIIGGIFSTKCPLGELIVSKFGSNVVFATEYIQFKFNASLFFIGSESESENKDLVNFVFENYKSSKSSSGGLETGYSITYNFYDFDNNNNNFYLSETNNRLNKIITAYQTMPLLYMVLGLFLIISCSVTNFISIKKNSSILISGRGYAIISFWLTSAVSFLIVSILNKFVPIMSLTAKAIFYTTSPIISSVAFIAWIVISILLTIAPIIKNRPIS